jgi:hypothetical protein
MQLRARLDREGNARRVVQGRHLTAAQARTESIKFFGRNKCPLKLILDRACR